MAVGIDQAITTDALERATRSGSGDAGQPGQRGQRGRREAVQGVEHEVTQTFGRGQRGRDDPFTRDADLLFDIDEREAGECRPRCERCRIGSSTCNGERDRRRGCLRTRGGVLGSANVWGQMCGDRPAVKKTKREGSRSVTKGDDGSRG
jgi:hypothetical protein